MRVGVLADDLTGALDTGVQFRNWGLTVEVLIGEVEETSELEDVDVVVVDTETRILMEEDAYIRVYNSTKSLTRLGAEKIYKKVDSTLRGNIGAELDAAIEGTHTSFAFFAPAYPTYGRFTLSGKQFVDNKPIDETDYAEELGVKSAEIAAIIGAQSKRRVGLVELDSVNRGPVHIKDSVLALKKDGFKVAVFDALTEKHLLDIARAAGDTKLFVGSAGFASEIPLGLGMRKIKPILSVCGSTRRLSRAQVKNLHDRLGFKEVDIGVIRLIEGEAAMRAEVERCVGEAVEALKDGVDVSITSSPREESAEGFVAQVELNGINEHRAKRLIEEAIGEITSAILKEVEVLGLILTGGATSLTICQKLGTVNIAIVEEIEPGIPLLKLSNGLPAVTKAGGFGVDDSLVQASQKLRRLMSN